jgi:hypothetical protein
MQNGQQETFRIAQSHRLARFKVSRLKIRYIQTYGDRPKKTVLQAHSVYHRLVIVSIHKTPQWREYPRCEEFKVTKVSIIQCDLRKIQCNFFEEGSPLRVDKEINERIPIRFNPFSAFHLYASK